MVNRNYRILEQCFFLLLKVKKKFFLTLGKSGKSALTLRVRKFSPYPEGKEIFLAFITENHWQCFKYTISEGKLDGNLHQITKISPAAPTIIIFLLYNWSSRDIAEEISETRVNFALCGRGEGRPKGEIFSEGKNAIFPYPEEKVKKKHWHGVWIPSFGSFTCTFIRWSHN